MTDIISVLPIGEDEEKLKLAVELSSTLAKNHECGVTIFVPVKKDLDKTILANVLGNKFVKNLIKNKPCTFNDNVSVLLISSQNPPLSMQGVVIALWTNSRMLGQLDDYLSLKTLSALVVYCTNPDDVKEWCEDNNAKKVPV